MFEELRRLTTARPFEPFLIILKNGNQIRIREPEGIEFTADGNVKIPDKKFYRLIAPDWIAEIGVWVSQTQVEDEEEQKEAAKVNELQALLDAEPFVPFSIVMGKREYPVSQKSDAEITDGGSVNYYSPKFSGTRALLNTRFITALKKVETEPIVRTIQEPRVRNPELEEAARKFAEEVREKEGDEQESIDPIPEAPLIVPVHKK